MLFNSLDYAILLIISTLFYWITRSVTVRKCILLVASIAFYASWSGKYLAILFICVFINWFFAKRFIETQKRFFLNLAVIGSLAILCFYKYTNFFVDNLWGLASFFGSYGNAPKWEILLPLGVSFYTFQLIAYTIDVARGKIEPEENPVDVGLFVLFFPHLIAGPICRAPQLIPQLKEQKVFKWEYFHDGLFMFLGGFFLKTCVADSIAPFVNVIFKNPENYSGVDNLWAAIGFSVQIYGDFCGYSLMALGSAKCFGIKLPFNFDLPYSSVSIKEFWRRWHITLSNWLKDFLYISLGGNRNGKLITYRNLALTMLLGGLWHGANWTFIVWGAIHGLSLAANQAFSSTAIGKKLSEQKIFDYMSWFLTMTVVLISWIFFRATSVENAWAFILKIVTVGKGWSISTLTVEYFEIIILFLLTHIVVHKYTFNTPVSTQKRWVSILLFVVFTFLSLVYYVDGKDFIYFQF